MRIDRKVVRIVARGPHGTLDVWDDRVTLNELRQEPGMGEALKLSGLVNMECVDEDEVYLFYVDDCFDPPQYLVCGANEQDAYDWFITEREDLIKIRDEDMKDYEITNPDGSTEFRGSHNDNGTAVDDEAVRMRKSRLVSVTFAE